MNEDSARDAAQQVWVEITKSFPSFRGESKISTWIYTITRRVALEHAKKERTFSTRFLSWYADKGDIDLPGGADLDKTLWVKQMCDKCITGILHCVDSETRLAHMLKDIAELEHREIAEILGKDAAAVRQMVSRSRSKVHSFLDDRCALYHPNGSCKCRMKRWVDEIDLAEEYRKIETIVGRVNFYRRSERILPGMDYWKMLL